MGFKNRTKKIIKPFVDVRKWVSFDEHQQTWHKLTDMVSRLAEPTTPEREETFEQAMARMNLSERGIEKRKRQYLMFAAFFLVAFILIFIYTMYLLIHKQFAASFLGLGVSGLTLAYAFRYHFWYFQIKKRRLGCTVQEWMGSKLK